MSSRRRLATLYHYEILQVLRNRRTILIAVVAPMVIFPALILLERFANAEREEELLAQSYEYVLVAEAAAETDVSARAEAILDRALALPSPGADSSDYQFQEVPSPDPRADLDEGYLDLLVEARRGADDGRLELVLSYRSDRDASRRAYDVVRSRLARIRSVDREEIFRSRGFPVELERAVPVEDENVATSGEEGGALLAMFLTPLLVMLMLGGAGIVAADAISGEKERGTLETLLTTAVSRREIVASKLLTIVTVGLVVMFVNIANLLAYLVFGLIRVPEQYSLEVGGGTLGLLAVLYLPVVLLVAAVLLLLSGYSKSYKEYQLYALPATFLFLIPAAAAALPGIDLRSAIAVVPLAGISVAVREVLTGELDWAFLGLAFASTGSAAAWVTRVTTGFLSKERLVTGAERDLADHAGGELLFRRHVLRWFGLVWVALIVSNIWFVGEWDIRFQALFNIVGLFFGASLLMLWRYDLRPRETLALRLPHPAVWVAVLIGAPSGLVAAELVFQLADLFVPVPEQMVEALGQSLMPEGMPFWQVILFVAVLPAIFEEIAFRGVLLHGLRRSLSPVPLVLAVGIIFGFFHVSLFRIAPTAYIGILLTAVVLLSGSILPAMAWHFLNNATALVLGARGIEVGAGGTPAWGYALAVVGLAVTFWILWRTRLPYPGLVGSEAGADGRAGSRDPVPGGHSG